MSTALSVVQSVRPIQPDYSRAEIIDTIKQTVAKGATDAQLAMFLEICKGTGLNPFLREIWFVPGVGIMAARDGYLRVANDHPMFDGMETLIERDAQAKPVKATCRVWRKDRSHPVTCEAYYSEYKKSSPTWTTYPSAMIGKVAEVLALKRSFSINGVVTEEEMGQQPQYEERGTIEAAQEVAQKKLAAARKPAAEVLGVQAEDVPADPHADLIDAIKAENTRIWGWKTFTDLVGVKAHTSAVYKSVFGVPGWKAVSNLSLESLAEGLSMLKKCPPYSEDLESEEPEITPIWTSNFKMLGDFGEQKKRLIELFGDEQGASEYYGILKAHGVEKSNQFVDMSAGMRCFVKLRAHFPAKEDS